MSQITINGVVTTLGADHAIGATTLVLAPGSGTTIDAALAELGLSLSPTTPLACTAIRIAAYGTGGAVTDRALTTVFTATGLGTDGTTGYPALTGVATTDGTTDIGFSAGDVLGFYADAELLNGKLDATGDGSQLTGITQSQVSGLTAALAAKVSTTGSPSSGRLAKFSGSTVIAAATAGTDYLAPAGDGSQLTGIVQSQVGGLTTSDAATFAKVKTGSAPGGSVPTTGAAYFGARTYFTAGNATFYVDASSASVVEFSSYNWFTGLPLDFKFQGNGGNVMYFGETDFGPAMEVVFVRNCSVRPANNPVNGVYVYALAGSLWVRKSDGTDVNLTP